ncbi:PAS domain S-box protein [Frigidibacter sp. MR17.24]|uniref:PAS domain S-box protein n=1 Tax=Frigidibacter sp. MR17.24 TaxID=3127345 RepID=UPI003012D595
MGADERGQSPDPGAFATAIDKALCLIWFSPDGIIEDVNDNFLRAAGYGRDGVVGRHHHLLVEEHYARSPDYRAFWHGLKQGRAQKGTFMRLGKSGRPFWLEASYIPLAGPDGRIERIVKLAHDVTVDRLATADHLGRLEAISQSHAIIEFELDGTILDANANFLKATGYALNEIRGRHHSMFVPPKDAAGEAYAHFWEKLCAGDVESGEFYRIGKDGRELWFQASYSPVLDAARRPVKIIKYATDVTERKRRSVDHNGQLTALTRTQAVIEFSLDGTVLTANENFLDLFGYEMSEIQGQHHRMFVAPGDMSGEAYAVFWRKLRQGQFQEAQYRRVAKGGEEVWIQASYNPIFDPYGNPFKVVKFATDITESKRAEVGEADRETARLRSAQDVIDAREIQFQATLDLAPVGMALLDEDCHMLHVNDALCRFTGYSAEELLSMRLATLIPPSRRVISETDRQRFRDGQIKLLQLERRVVRKNGGEAWAMLHISQQTSSRSDAVQFIVQVQDITERRQMEEMKSNFVATVSHELRTPLTSIKGGLSLVLGSMSLEMGDRAQRLLSIALKNCDRLTLLVNDILDMEKISSGQARFQQKNVGLADLLEQAVAINAAYGREHGVEFALAQPSDEAWIRVDVDRFQQVMSNLMSNAAKFSPKGSVVRVESELRDHRVFIRVIDRGPGIPEDFRDRIFMPFSQANNSDTREMGGTGLGLNITRQIIERMGGEIGYQNLPEGGCEFRVEFRAVNAKGGAEGRIPGLGFKGRCPEILHVEDDRDFAEVFEHAFSGRAAVSHASSFADVARLLGERQFDLVVIDWDNMISGGTELLDMIERLQPELQTIGLSDIDGPTDPRVAQNLIKSRVTLAGFVEKLLS